MNALTQENLYHFTSAEIAANYILRDFTIKLNNFRDVNDPKEACEWPFYFFDDTSFSSTNDITIEDFNKLDNYVKSHTLIACFKHESGCNINELYDDQENIRAFYDMRMWHQYADRHKGVCLVFDRNVLINNLNKDNDTSFFHGPVVYGKLINSPDDPFAIDFHRFRNEGEKYLSCKLHQHVQDFFFTKTTSWQDESEYRIVALCESDMDHSFLDVSNSLKAIILGIDVTKEVSNEIRSKVNFSVPIYQIDHRYWTTTICQVDVDEPEKIYILDGIHFSTNIPCYYVQTRLKNALGQPGMVRIEAESGNVFILG